jgi:hypothetical protein
MDKPTTFTPEALHAFRKAIALQTAFWDASISLERIIGFEVDDCAFGDAAFELDHPSQAILLSDVELTDLLASSLGAELDASP